MTIFRKTQPLFTALLILILTVLTACGGGGNTAKPADAGAKTEKTGAAAPAAAPVTIKLGLLKNVTHAPAFVAIKQNFLQKQIGAQNKFEVVAFDNGGEFSTALASGQIDIGFVGPGPVTNQYVRSKNLKIISGANNGGAVFVARKGSGVTDVKGLVGKTVAIPTKGSTNEISLRLLLDQAGVKVTTDETGAQLVALAPADTLVAFRQGQVDAALLPEPWGTQIAQEGLGDIVVDWDKVPPNNGNYPLTIVVASDAFLKDHRDLAKAVLRANLEAIAYLKEHPNESYGLVNDLLKELTSKGLAPELIKIALSHLTLTPDINKASVEEMAKVSIDAGYIKGVDKQSLDLSGLFDLSLLKEVQSGK